MKTVLGLSSKRSDVQAAIDRIGEKIASEKKGPPPYLSISSFDSKRCAVSFYLLAPDQPRLGSFFYEMLSRSLPGKVGLFFLAEAEEGLMAAEVEVVFRSQGEWQAHKGQIELLRHELLIGLRSAYHASRILEIKGMSIEDKRVRVQEKATETIHRFPNRFDYDFFSFVQHFFLHAHQESLRFHEVRQISENLSGFYLMKKKLIGLLELHRGERHVKIKIRKRRLHLPFGTRSVLGITVGITLLREHEVFSKKHLLRGLQTLLPQVSYVEESVYVYEDSEYPLVILYLEIHSDQETFLRRELPLALKGRVEQLQRPLFMPRNEEEIMRHVVTLGGQLKFARDFPQVIITFHGQTDESLDFTIIVARVLLSKTPSAEEVQTKLDSLKPQMERVKKIGMIRKKYFKEAIVFKIALPSQNFIREDQSVDLHEARLSILQELENALGDVRDYNGGMISKQNEVLRETVRLLGETGQKHRLLLDHFFYALFPIEKRSLIDPMQIKTLFVLFLEMIETGQTKKWIKEGEKLYLLLETKEKEKWLQLISQHATSRPVTLQLDHDERFFLGVILERDDDLQKQIFNMDPFRSNML